VSEIRQGQVYWLDFGAAAGSAPAERHPCVVVQNDVFNRSANARGVRLGQIRGNQAHHGGCNVYDNGIEPGEKRVLAGIKAKVRPVLYT
jgi:hypothetical protein